LFGSIARLGLIDATMFTPDQIQLIGWLDAVDIIEVHGAPIFSDTAISSPIPT
jgi:hypothetical protein